MKLEINLDQAMKLLEYALNELEFKVPKKVTGIKPGQGTSTTFSLTLEQPLRKEGERK